MWLAYPYAPRTVTGMTATYATPTTTPTKSVDAWLKENDRILRTWEASQPLESEEAEDEAFVSFCLDSGIEPESALVLYVTA